MKKNKIIIIAFIIIAFCVFIVIKQTVNSKKYEKIDMNQLFVKDKTEITNDIQQSETIKVHITGEVRNPGLLELEVGSRIDDAIQLAGGLTDRADISKTNLAYILSDGEKIYIPSENDEEVELTNGQGSNSKVNINTATISELETIPGVGEATANSIIEYRNNNRKICYNRRYSKCFWNWPK